MLFTWDTTNLCVVFPWWHVTGPWSLLFTLLGIVGLGMCYEVLRLLARKYDEHTIGTIRLGSPNNDDDQHPQQLNLKYALSTSQTESNVGWREGDMLLGRCC